MRWETVTKTVVVISVLLAETTQDVLAAREAPALPFVSGLAFVSMLLAVRRFPHQALSLVLVGLYLARGVMFLAFGYIFLYFIPVTACILGIILAKPNLHIWHFPREWKIPLVLWALTVALSWPIVFLREVNFTPVLTLNTPAFNNRGGLPTNVAAAWVLQTAVIQGVGFLWIDWLFGTFRTDQRERFARYVLVPLGTSFVLTSLVAFYQAFIDIRFLNGPAWIGAGQASGALMDANPLGVLAACWGPTFLVPTLTGQHRGRRVIAITAMAVSWLSVLSSGSRSTLLIAGIAVLYLLWLGWKVAITARHPHWLTWGVVSICLVVGLTLASLSSSVSTPIQRIRRSLPSSSQPSLIKKVIESQLGGPTSRLACCPSHDRGSPSHRCRSGKL